MGRKKLREIIYDMTDAEYQCIRITEHGWNIIKNSNILFVRFNQRAQVIPDRNYTNDIFDQYLDLMQIRDLITRLLIKVWTISLLIPDIPHPIAIIHGEKGGSKSTFCRYQKRLIDPDRIEINNIPSDKSEFVQQLYHNSLAVYDNVKYLPSWFSDEVCKAVTGGGNSKRTLYTNDDDTIYNYKRSVIVSGINNWLTETDALDRSIIIELERIPEDKRKEEEEIETAFETMKSKLFAYCLDTLSKALQIKPQIKLSNLPRMADFAGWGEAIARAMGYKDMEFVKAYSENIGRQNVEVIEELQLAQAIEKFVDSWKEDSDANKSTSCWEGSPSDLLQSLNNVAMLYKMDTDNKSWPKAGNSLTRKLRPILSNLREGLGIHVIITRQTTEDSKKKKNTSIIRIRKIHPLSPLPPSVQDYARNQNKDSGDILNVGDNVSTQRLISPPANGRNRAQETESGSSGHSGDIIITNPVGLQLSSEIGLAITTISLDRNNSLSLSSNNKNSIFANYVAMDLEWMTYDSDEKSIYAASFVNNTGSTCVLHISDFNSERDLLEAIKQEIMQYPMSIGWNTTGIDSDLAMLNERCMKNGIPSPIGYDDRGITFVEGRTHIDLYKVFRNEIIKTSIFKNKYKSLKLDDVSRTILGKGKVTEISGENAYTKSIEEQKRYVLRDSELVMDLSKFGNNEILDLMLAISELTGLKLEEACHTSISRWWSNVFENMGLFTAPSSSPPTSKTNNHTNIQDKEAYEYEGGKVIDSRKGVYHDLKIVDVVSLYPSMAILHNISFDTVNCVCCSDREDAKVLPRVIDKGYWICKQKDGAFPIKLREFKAERMRQKQLGNNTKQQGLKILINGGYGLFGNKGFRYADIRVAELITAYGRYTLNQMQLIAASNNLDIIGGDTDSLFLQTNNDKALTKFISECKEKLYIDLEHDKTFTKAIVTKKKHYLGVTGRGDIVIKGMEGKKHDRPLWINTVFNQFVKDILTDADPLANLTDSIMQLEEYKVSINDLKISVRLSKDPDQYSVNNIQKKIGQMLQLKKDDVIYYYKSNNKDGITLDPNEISIRKYKAMLWNSVKDILEVAGYNITTIEEEFFADNCNKTSDIQSLPEVANM